jgi:UDP-N-acetylglucosamine 2-epimerase (non-hydrolysing)
MVVKIVFVAGARPNFPKIAPLMRAFKDIDGVELGLVHTGQHYDFSMSDSFFADLDIPAPNINLGVNGGSQAENTGKIMVEFEKYVLSEKPNLIVVVGDVNSTLACGIVAKKCNIKLVHVEAGLRSFDETMPEEINRILVDRISDYLFITEESGITNLNNEGVPNHKIFLVGNVMIDSLIYALPKIEKSNIVEKLNLNKSVDYSVLTLHRPALVDSKKRLEECVDFLVKISEKLKIIWPIHPRTKEKIKLFNLESKIRGAKNILVTEPLVYLDFMKLILGSKLILTDSGGIQEEASFLKIPCLTFRENTERPSTIELGTNILTGFDYELATTEINSILLGKTKSYQEIPLWDGEAAKRIRDILLKEF